MTMPLEYAADPIRYLLRREFGEHAVIGPISGLTDDEEKAQAQYFREVEQFRTELQHLGQKELLARAEQEWAKEERELGEAEERAPFYNRPESKADFQYWARVPLWTLDEALALTLDKDPRVVTWQRLEEHDEPSLFKADFSDLRLLVHRAKEDRQLDTPVSPARYIAWAKDNGISVPSDLEKSVQASKGKVPNWKELYEEEKRKHVSTKDELERLKTAGKPFGEKEKNTFYKLFLGMAVVKYEYKPRQGKAPNARRITHDLYKVGISIDEDTVRDKLQKAYYAVGDNLLD